MKEQNASTFKGLNELVTNHVPIQAVLNLRLRFHALSVKNSDVDVEPSDRESQTEINKLRCFRE